MTLVKIGGCVTLTLPRSLVRELGLVPLIGGTPGALDAITDVAGVEVGQTTLVSGEGRLVVGKGPVRTGVTAVHPRCRTSADAVRSASRPPRK